MNWLMVLVYFSLFVVLFLSVTTRSFSSYCSDTSFVVSDSKQFKW